MKYNLIWIAVLMMGLMVACDDEDEGVQPANEVWMADDAFLPDDLTVPSGTEVRWVNTSDVDHTVTSLDGLFEEYLEPGDAFSYTFIDSETYPYTCTIHADMEGVINVQ